MIELNGDFVSESRFETLSSLEEAIKNLDVSDMLKLLGDFPEQNAEARRLQASPPLARKVAVKNVVFCGLGGSAIAGDLLCAAFSQKIKVPAVVCRDYHLPPWTGPETLVVALSYSGNTEETLSAWHEARRAKAVTASITSGGKLGELTAGENLPLVTIPAGQPPRTALGYLFWTAALCLESAGIMAISDAEQDEILGALRDVASGCQPSREASVNPARQLAAALRGTVPVIYSGGFLSAVAVRWKCQLEENSKHFAVTGQMPEMNHNEVVGWANPEEALKKMAPVFLRDPADEPQVRKRFAITADLLKPRRFSCEVSGTATGSLARLFSLLVFGDWVSYYLALENMVDPTPVERITLLKKRLAD